MNSMIRKITGADDPGSTALDDLWDLFNSRLRHRATKWHHIICYEIHFSRL